MKTTLFPLPRVRFADLLETMRPAGSALIGSLFLLALAGPAHGASGAWSKSGNGDWGDPLNWTGGVPNGTGESATFNGSGYTVDLSGVSGGVTVGRLEVADGVTPTWLLTGGGLTLAASSPGTPVISNEGTMLQIASILAGTQGFTKEGTGRLYLSNTGNSITGDVTINGGSLLVSGASVLNGNKIILGGSGTSTFLISGTGNYQNDTVLNASTNSISSANNTNATYSGTISELGGSRDLTLYVNGGTATITVSGDNSYTGNTAIGSASATLRAVITNDNALGLGTDATVYLHDNSSDLLNALVLKGGIHVTGKNFILKGRGIGQEGSLVSSDGENIWEGNLSLGTGKVTDYAATIGVDEDSVLTVKGVISNPVAQTQGLAKVGLGTLILDGENTYTTGTLVSEGTLVVNGSLAKQGAVLVSSGATLAVGGKIGGNTSIASGGRLTGGADAGELRFESDLHLAAGSQAILRFVTDEGSLSHDWLQVEGTLTLSLGGTLEVDAAGLSSSHIGQVYTLAAWDELVAGGFDVDTDLVFVNLDPSLTILTDNFLVNGTVTVIPEPGTVALLFGAACLLGGPLLRKRRAARV
ncbi:MAG TPA: autotransporter-associated beta strand repeat-containing protein [Chthoniobacteraceae bacterium]|nr:autotransporter-associated beta strand repeat-containing protein [Chthoniobacteraceae bacterium]